MMSFFSRFKRVLGRAKAVPYGSAPALLAESPSLATELAAAVNADDAEQMADLLARGADPSAPDPVHGWTALQRAAANGHEACLHLLLKHGADAHVVSNAGFTLLHLAANGMCPALFAPLVAVGLDVNARSPSGDTPLFIAASLDDAPSIAQLLALGADAGLTNHAGKTALDAAVDRETDPFNAWSTEQAQALLRTCS